MSTSEPQPTAPLHALDPSNAGEHFTNLERLRLLIGVLVAYGAFRGIGELTRAPLVPGFSASLVQDEAILGLIGIAIAFVLVTAVTTLIAGKFRFEAGLFCAAFGLIAVPTRGGTITDAILMADGARGVYFLLAIETVLLSAILYAGYFVQQRFNRRPAAVAPAKDPDTRGDRITVVGVQALTTLVLLMLVGQSPAKGQALIGIGVCSLLAALMTHQGYKVRGSQWYVAGTMLAGVIAHVYTGLSGADGANIGEVRGWLAGAARSLPLHYASLGAAGAIYGYWISMVWLGPPAAEKPAAAKA